MKLNNKLFAQMRAATRNLMHKSPVDTNQVIQDALKNASVYTEAAQQHMRGMGQMPTGSSPQQGTPAVDVQGMLAELSRNFSQGIGQGTGYRAANEPAEVLPGSFSEGSHTNAAGTRSYKLYVPSGYRGEPVPLVVMLHGCTQDPDDFATGTKMNALAEEMNCLVVYPAQSRQANASRCWNWFNNVDQRRDQGEPSIIAGITRDIMARYTIDKAKVYVAGLSAGGAMAAIMGTLYPDLYAAVGVHSGLPFAAAHDLPSALAAMKGDFRRGHQPNKAIPIIVFHGDQDTTVHPTNGDAIMVPARDAADAMAIEPGRVPNGHAFTRTVHKRADGKPRGEHWVIHGAGHAWSGGSARGSYTDGKGRMPAAR
ncbi:PHB depolymerase family esterase [Massilia sp. Dwa41.01b]|uniref:extracellular catalytic domain type 1 short-chain-length polyhydroxyalkanoate depolymerase n=1 Tax=Massilia sp. Dwa41.01b TaxID=2709302 RepID=UPI0028042339|nr:PHB depolymerase family esterase [Massilia sp. Dwa41.01b]